jgi:polyisoprenoid-binding protein YceI
VKRPFIIGGSVLGIVLVAGGAAAYAYFFSGLRSTPKPLALASPSPKASSTASASTDSGTLVGAWKVAQGSQAGYRVSEQFVGQTSSHDAVARTSDVSGGLTVQQAGSGLQATAVKITAALTSLHSVDSVAGFNVSNRDRLVSQSLDVSQYPDAIFQARSVELPAGLATGPQTVTIPGQLTIHGVTRPATVTAQVQVSGSQAQVAGSTSFAMTDFGVSPPQVPFTSVQPRVTLEFQLSMVKS